MPIEIIAIWQINISNGGNIRKQSDLGDAAARHLPDRSVLADLFVTLLYE